MLKVRKDGHCERCGEPMVLSGVRKLCATCSALPLTPRERFSVMLASSWELVSRSVGVLERGMRLPQFRYEYDAKLAPDRPAAAQLNASRYAHIGILGVFAPDARWTLRVGADLVAEGIESKVLAEGRIIGEGAHVHHDGAESLFIVIVEPGA